VGISRVRSQLTITRLSFGCLNSCFISKICSNFPYVAVQWKHQAITQGIWKNTRSCTWWCPTITQLIYDFDSTPSYFGTMLFPTQDQFCIFILVSYVWLQFRVIASTDYSFPYGIQYLPNIEVTTVCALEPVGFLMFLSYPLRSNGNKYDFISSVKKTIVFYSHLHF
jgi:hypothetical protein